MLKLLGILFVCLKLALSLGKFSFEFNWNELLIDYSRFWWLEIKSTDYIQAGRPAILECAPGFIIFVSRTEHRVIDKPHCKGVDERCDYYTSKCNGLQNCHPLVEMKTHKIGIFRTDCTFVSNMTKIFYSCVPSKLP